MQKTYRIKKGLIWMRRMEGELSEIECFAISHVKVRNHYNARIYVYWKNKARPRFFLASTSYWISASRVMNEISFKTGLPCLIIP
jgi:hypothetical protein